MKRLWLTYVIPLFLLACLAPADAPPTSDEAGFVALFNGKDTQGWVYGSRRGHVRKFGKGYQYQGDVLYCTANEGGDLFTEKEYSDFILRFQFKLTDNANNGIGIRAPLDGDAAYVGMEIQILDDGGSEYKTLPAVSYHGSVYGVVAAKRGHQKPVGEWNEEEIFAQGPHIRVTLNSAVIVDTNLNDVKDPQLLKRHPGLHNAKGHIGLLGHGSRVDFRNMRIKDLAAAESRPAESNSTSKR